MTSLGSRIKFRNFKIYLVLGILWRHKTNPKNVNSIIWVSKVRSVFQESLITLLNIWENVFQTALKTSTDLRYIEKWIVLLKGISSWFISQKIAKFEINPSEEIAFEIMHVTGCDACLFEGAVAFFDVLKSTWVCSNLIEPIMARENAEPLSGFFWVACIRPSIATRLP